MPGGYDENANRVSAIHRRTGDIRLELPRQVQRSFIKAHTTGLDADTPTKSGTSFAARIRSSAHRPCDDFRRESVSAIIRSLCHGLIVGDPAPT